MGNALTDVLATLKDDALLARMELPKGSMQLIDADKLQLINDEFARMETQLATGGSACNTIRGLAALGTPTGFIGKVGTDRYGKFYRENLLHYHIADKMLTGDLPSGVASTFISPDGERTFGTYLGAAATLRAEDLTPEMFKDYACLYIEGYLVQDHEMIERAMILAKEEGLQVCLDLASYNIVEAEREFFHKLMEKYVDIVFANEEEARAFTGEAPEMAVESLSKLCSIAIVKVGAHGSYIRKGTQSLHVPALHIQQVTDTTGAGDYFAAGFLFGLVEGCSLDKCAAVGSLLAGNVIQVVGAHLPDSRWSEIKAHVTNMLHS
jgi:sugar/nucleoside kinase (ribokinase family)